MLDNSNKIMSNVNIADQLWGSYWFDHWLRNRKWWWLLMFLSIGVIIKNVYVMYVTYNLSAGKNLKNIYHIMTSRKQSYMRGLSQKNIRRA